SVAGRPGTADDLARGGRPVDGLGTRRGAAGRASDTGRATQRHPLGRTRGRSRRGRSTRGGRLRGSRPGTRSGRGRASAGAAVRAGGTTPVPVTDPERRGVLQLDRSTATGFAIDRRSRVEQLLLCPLSALADAGSLAQRDRSLADTGDLVGLVRVLDLDVEQE